MEYEMSPLVQQHIPQQIKNCEFKIKLSDWESARKETPFRLPIAGYIQKLTVL
jgi:hypothetical protein